MRHVLRSDDWLRSCDAPQLPCMVDKAEVGKPATHLTACPSPRTLYHPSDATPPIPSVSIPSRYVRAGMLPYLRKAIGPLPFLCSVLCGSGGRPTPGRRPAHPEGLSGHGTALT